MLGVETTTMRTGDHFRIGPQRPGDDGATLAALAAEAVLVSIVFIKVRFLSPPYRNC